MTHILAYTRSATKELTSLNMIADSSASVHMTLHCDWFKCGTFKELNPPHKIHFGDNSHVKATGISTVTLNCKINGATKTTELDNVLYVPSFQLILMSIYRLKKSEHYMVFKNGLYKVKTVKKQETVCNGVMGLRELNGHNAQNQTSWSIDYVV